MGFLVEGLSREAVLRPAVDEVQVEGFWRELEPFAEKRELCSGYKIGVEVTFFDVVESAPEQRSRLFHQGLPP